MNLCSPLKESLVMLFCIICLLSSAFMMFLSWTTAIVFWCWVYSAGLGLSGDGFYFFGWRHCRSGCHITIAFFNSLWVELKLWNWFSSKEIVDFVELRIDLFQAGCCFCLCDLVWTGEYWFGAGVASWPATKFDIFWV